MHELNCNVYHIISSLPQNIRNTWMIVHFCSQCKKFNNYKPCRSPYVFLYCLNDLNKTKTKIYNYDDTVFHDTLEIVVPCLLLMIYRFNKLLYQKQWSIKSWSNLPVGPHLIVFILFRKILLSWYKEKCSLSEIESDS